MKYPVSHQLCLRVWGTCGYIRGGGQERLTRGEKLAVVIVLDYRKTKKSAGTEKGNRELKEPR